MFFYYLIAGKTMEDFPSPARVAGRRWTEETSIGVHMGSGRSAFGCGSQSAHMRLRPSMSPEETHSPHTATTGPLKRLAQLSLRHFLPHLWRESYEALRVLPHALSELPGGR
jgi:hypothetical protein